MTEPNKTAGKGRPTPTRKEREAAQRRPLVGDKSPEAKKAAKAKLAEERRKAREGMSNGDERYLTARDRGPQRRMARDIVDSQFTIGEMILPSLMVVILISAVDDFLVQLITLIVMWVLFLAVGINAYFIGRGAARRIGEKFGVENLERGIRWYAAMRSIQMRPMRLPKAQVKRGTKI